MEAADTAEQALGSQGHPPSHPGSGGAKGCSRLRLERFLLSLASKLVSLEKILSPGAELYHSPLLPLAVALESKGAVHAQ